MHRNAEIFFSNINKMNFIDHIITYLVIHSFIHSTYLVAAILLLSYNNNCVGNVLKVMEK